MQDLQKKEFTLRISQANRTQLTVLIFEMALIYLQDAKAAEGEDDFGLEIKRARSCVDELKRALDFRYELSNVLLHQYIQINKLLVRASLSGKKEYLDRVSAMLTKLKEAFEQVAKEDTSGPVIENAQTVYAGYTYGKNDINVNLDNNSTGRGFLV